MSHYWRQPISRLSYAVDVFYVFLFEKWDGCCSNGHSL